LILSPLSPEECYHIFHLIVRKGVTKELVQWFNRNIYCRRPSINKRKEVTFN